MSSETTTIESVIRLLDVRKPSGVLAFGVPLVTGIFTALFVGPGDLRARFDPDHPSYKDWLLLTLHIVFWCVVIAIGVIAAAHVRDRRKRKLSLQQTRDLGGPAKDVADTSIAHSVAVAAVDTTSGAIASLNFNEFLIVHTLGWARVNSVGLRTIKSIGATAEIDRLRTEVAVDSLLDRELLERTRFGDATRPAEFALTAAGRAEATKLLDLDHDPHGAWLIYSPPSWGAALCSHDWNFVYNPPAHSKELNLLPNGKIVKGNNQNENSWRCGKNEYLELIREDGRVQNRFFFDEHG